MNQVQIVGACCRRAFPVADVLGLKNLVVALFLLLALTLPACAADPTGAKNILVLYSFSDPTGPESVGPLESALRTGAPWPLTFDIEFLESRRFDDKLYERGVVETLHNSLGREPDLVIVAAYPALQFALRHRDELFPDAPIVFFSVDTSRLAGQKIWPGVTGVTVTNDVRATIELALHAHPDRNTVVVIAGTSEFETYWFNRVHAELLQRRDKLKEIDLIALPPDQLMKQVAALPPKTFALFQIAPVASIQPTVGAFDVLASLGQRTPTYCIFPSICLNHGGIGGAEADSDKEYALLAQQTRRVLSGERPEDVPIVHADAPRILVDWRQLRRWHVLESALPPGTLVLYRQPTFWQTYENYIIAGIVLIVVQTSLIIGLLLQRSRKRKAEAVLRESEQRFRVMADSTPSLVWMCDQKGEMTYLNDRRVAFTGPNPAFDYRDGWSAYIHPDDVHRVLQAFSEALKGQHTLSQEYRLRRYDGTFRWMFDVAAPRLNGDGSFAGFVGSAIDITDQKLAQEALENVSGKLIEAQEKERSRIARDLHDDICQRLALLSMKLEQANRNGAPPSTKKHLEEIRQYCSEIAGDVQALSHQLHSSKLDYLGIVAAIRGFCKEFANQHNVNVRFTDENVPTHLPKDVSLCLFRINQEALHNAVKYSGTSDFQVDVRALSNGVQLTVKDDGRGFNVEEAKRNGLGLISMQERVHLVQGELRVESKSGAGTRIVATVPLMTVVESVSQNNSTRAMGVA